MPIMPVSVTGTVRLMSAITVAAIAVLSGTGRIDTLFDPVVLLPPLSNGLLSSRVDAT